MSPETWLDDLVWRLVSSEEGANVVSADDLSDWPNGAVSELSRLGVLDEHTPASRAICPNCEAGHVEDVAFSSDSSGVNHAVIYCPTTGRAEIDLAALRQWRLEADGLAGLIRARIGAAGNLQLQRRGRSWSLGVLTDGDSTREIVLDLDGPGPTEDSERAGVACLIGGLRGKSTSVVLRDVLAWDGVTLTVDRARLSRGLSEAAEPVPASFVPEYRLRREGSGWTAAFKSQPVRGLPRLKGLADIHILLARADQPVPVIELADIHLVENGVPLVTAAALKQLRAFMAKQDVRDKDIEQYLRSVCRLDGRPRTTASSLTKAVTTVRNRIDRAIREIGHESVPMAEHFDRFIKKGLVCSYRPPEHIEWEL